MIMNLMVRRCAVACALVLALCGCSGSTGTSGAPAPAAVPPAASSTYTLMQMNLCLSGLAGCYGKAAYPAVVEEAVARIDPGQRLNEGALAVIDMPRGPDDNALHADQSYRRRAFRFAASQTPGARPFLARTGLGEAPGVQPVARQLQHVGRSLGVDLVARPGHPQHAGGGAVDGVGIVAGAGNAFLRFLWFLPVLRFLRFLWFLWFLLFLWFLRRW